MYLQQDIPFRFCKIGSRHLVTFSWKEATIYIWDSRFLGTDQDSRVKQFFQCFTSFFFTLGQAPNHHLIYLSSWFTECLWNVLVYILLNFQMTSPHLLANGDGTKNATIVGDVYVHPSAKVHPTAKVISFYLASTFSCVNLLKIKNKNFFMCIQYNCALVIHQTS